MLSDYLKSKLVEDSKRIMFKSIYEDNFSDIKDVIASFWISEELLSGANILYASYEEDGPYDGYAYVLLERDNILYEVHASHCSCMGLEDQWSEEPTLWEAIKKNNSVMRCIERHPELVAYLEDKYKE